MSHVAVRTCVGCRQRAEVGELLRIVLDPDQPMGASTEVRADPRHRLVGRGAWVHPTLACVATADRRRAFGRALRVSAAVSSSRVTEYVETLARIHLEPAMTDGTAFAVPNSRE